MQADFFFWLSIVTSVIGAVLLFISIWQHFDARKERERNKAQIKVWMQQANGLQFGLRRIVGNADANHYSSIKDVSNAVWAIEANAFSLYQSLYEERVMTEDEYKKEQKKLKEQLEGTLDRNTSTTQQEKQLQQVKKS